MKKLKRLSTKKKVLIALVGLVLVAGAGYAFMRYRDNNSGEEGTINYGPPTEQEKQQAEDNKDAVAERIKLENEATQNPPSPNNKKSVTPIITHAAENDGQIHINAYVPGIFEEGGTCTATLTKDGATVTANSAGFGNVSTTGCTPIHIPRGEFSSSGDWKLVLSYSSNTAQGNSDSKTVRVP